MPERPAEPTTDPIPDPITDPLLARLLDAGRLREVERAGERRQLLAAVAAESATVLGTLVELADRGVPVAARTRGGRVQLGTVALVGADFVVLEGERGQLWCRLAALASLRVAGPAPLASGARNGTDVHLQDALALLVDDQPRLVLDLQSGETVAGDLLAVGVDVVSVGLDGGDVLYVPCGSLDAVLRSG